MARKIRTRKRSRSTHPALPRSTPTPTLPQDTGEGVKKLGAIIHARAQREAAVFYDGSSAVARSGGVSVSTKATTPVRLPSTVAANHNSPSAIASAFAIPAIPNSIR